MYSKSRSRSTKGTIKAARKFYFLGNDFRAGGLSLSASCGSFAEKLVGARVTFIGSRCLENDLRTAMKISTVAEIVENSKILVARREFCFQRI